MIYLKLTLSICLSTKLQIKGKDTLNLFVKISMTNKHLLYNLLGPSVFLLVCSSYTYRRILHCIRMFVFSNSILNNSGQLWKETFGHWVTGSFIRGAIKFVDKAILSILFSLSLPFLSLSLSLFLLPFSLSLSLHLPLLGF